MKCENCQKKHNGSYGSGRFCSQKCARAYATKLNRKEINKKVSLTMRGTGDSSESRKDKCPICGGTKNKVSKRCKFCIPQVTAKTRKKLSKLMKERCKSPEERKRLRDIGRKGGFGKKGYTRNGTRYESLLEKSVFEYLEDNKINFEAHKSIPNSSKISDVFLPKLNLWIELDGINREKRKKWLKNDYKYWKNKLKIYELQNLNYRICYNLKDFIGLLA